MQSGAFIALYDEASLKLYLKHGVYSTLLRVWNQQSSKATKHFAALSDYCALRPGSEIFFFIKRKIYYGGRLIGPETSNTDTAGYFLNGPLSPWAQKAAAPILWDESNRARYSVSAPPGVFKIPGEFRPPDIGERFQPYLIKFDTTSDLSGRCIASDALYWATAKEHMFPLPSNSMEGMSFCIISPEEVRIAMDLFRKSDKRIDLRDAEPSCATSQKPSPANSPNHAMPSNLSDAYRRAFNENELEALILSKPELLKDAVELKTSDALARQIPLCPFKSGGMDRADIVFYSNAGDFGALPRAIVEVKLGQANKACYNQVARYLEWIALARDKDFARRVIAVLVVSSAHKKARAPKEWPNILTLTPAGIHD